MRRRLSPTLVACAVLAMASACNKTEPELPPKPPGVAETSVAGMTAFVGGYSYSLVPPNNDRDTISQVAGQARKLLASCADQEGEYLQDKSPQARKRANAIVACVNKAAKSPVEVRNEVSKKWEPTHPGFSIKIDDEVEK